MSIYDRFDWSKEFITMFNRFDWSNENVVVKVDKEIYTVVLDKNLIKKEMEAVQEGLDVTKP